jgi:hypothetical protein
MRGCLQRTAAVLAALACSLFRLFRLRAFGDYPGMARVALALLLSAALLAFAACGADEEPEVQPPEAPPPAETEPPEPDPAETDDLAAETITCTNEEAGYTVEYPADWHTNEGDGPQACSYFDPEPIEVPEATEFFGAAVLVSREPVAAEDLVEGPDPTREVLEREETEVAGQRAFRIESESTGDGLLDAGVRYYEIVVVLDGESLILSTYDLEEHDYERNREVVDEMAASLQLLDGAGADDGY